MKKRNVLCVPDILIILAAMCYVLLDTFVIARPYAAAAEAASPVYEISSEQQETVSASAEREPIITDTSYQDENISVTLKEYRTEDTTIHVADVILSSPEYLKSVLADNTYGRNITAETSEMASAANAILAINGDYYGARNKGYVIRNGVLYRTEAASSSQEDLVIHTDGSFEIITEGQIAAENISDAMQVYSFGPGLLEDGEITVSKTDEVGKAKASNPRTAIAEIEPLHYLFVVSDGRSDYSEGLSLYELASFLKEQGAVTAYNLDGGGSSTMIFNGTLVNYPTTSGRTVKERSVSDAVVIGY
ncbi:MAG: phosphodiester glycosidase family protein [Solobacterium sp.]|nr:phosphodiester glycosidase family protein [Solobacterium sp.]